MANFIAELKLALNSVVDLVKNEVSKITADIDSNVAVMQTAYDNIKADKVQLGEIGAVVDEFAHDLTDVAVDTNDSRDDADMIINDCYELVADDILVDEDINFNEEEEEDEEDYPEQFTIADSVDHDPETAEVSTDSEDIA